MPKKLLKNLQNAYCLKKFLLDEIEVWTLVCNNSRSPPYPVLGCHCVAIQRSTPRHQFIRDLCKTIMQVLVFFFCWVELSLESPCVWIPECGTHFKTQTRWLVSKTITSCCFKIVQISKVFQETLWPSLLQSYQSTRSSTQHMVQNPCSLSQIRFHMQLEPSTRPIKERKSHVAITRILKNQIEF